MKEIVGKNGLQILTFWRSLPTGKMCSSSRSGDRQTANAGNVGSRDPLCRSREKKYAVLNLSNDALVGTSMTISDVYDIFAIHLIPKWPPFKDSFVFIQISP